jgi:ribonuclease D
MSFFSFFRRYLKKKKSLFFVSDKKSLKIMDIDLSESKIIGIDTEFDWRTTYFPILSIVQISTLNHLYLIDCLKVDPKITLKKCIENKNVLKIFHSARSDTTVLSKCLECKTKNVFDIQVAEKFLENGEPKAYGKIVKKYFGIDLKQSETNSNWLKRPLTENQISYAFEDVDFLIDIYYFQKKKLIRNALFEKVLQVSKKEADLGNESLKKLRIEKKQKKLSNRNINIFKWREEIAEAQNIPPTYIFHEKDLKKLSKIARNDNSSKKQIMTIIGDTRLTEDFISKFL